MSGRSAPGRTRRGACCAGSPCAARLRAGGLYRTCCVSLRVAHCRFAGAALGTALGIGGARSLPRQASWPPCYRAARRSQANVGASDRTGCDQEKGHHPPKNLPANPLRSPCSSVEDLRSDLAPIWGSGCAISTTLAPERHQRSRLALGLFAPHNASIAGDLTDDDKEAIAALLRDVIAADRFPYSPRIRHLKTSWNRQRRPPSLCRHRGRPQCRALRCRRSGDIRTPLADRSLIPGIVERAAVPRQPPAL